MIAETAADARVFLGIGLEEFLDLTPKYLALLFERLRRRREIDDSLLEVMLAQLTAMVANTGFKGWDVARKVDEFRPSQWGKPSAARRRRERKPDEVDDDIRKYFAAFE